MTSANTPRSESKTALPVSHGRFVWYDLLTTDVAAATSFYTNIAGWGTHELDMGLGRKYQVWTPDDVPLGGVVRLKPETGRSYDIGFVYDPHWLEGLSISVDSWRINLQDTISTVSAQTVLNQCYANASSAFCALIHRNGNGTINYVAEPTVNLGKLWAAGTDFGASYRSPETAYGRFNASLNGTYMKRYDINPDTTDPSSVVIHNAGIYTYSYGNFPRWRALGTLGWMFGNWSASWRLRYVGKSQIGSADLNQGLSADYDQAGVERKINAYLYHKLQVAYDFARWHTKLELGVDNLTDKQPSLYYANNVTNANTDVATYDLLGRYYWLRATVKF